MQPHRSLDIVLATVGSRGDVQPMLALAQVFLAANRDMMTGSPLKMLKEIVRYFKEQIPMQARQLQAICADADGVLYGGLAFTAPTVAEHFKLPVLGVFYTNCLLPSGQHPPPNLPWHGLPRWLNRLLWFTNRILGDLLVRGTLNQMRAEVSLPPVRHVRAHLTDDHPLINAADNVVLPPDPQWQGRYPYANFLYFNDPETLDPALEAWLADGEPPVCVGFGSMSGKGTDRIEHMLVEAIALTGRRCNSPLAPGWPPPRGCRPAMRQVISFVSLRQ
jgi:UDP:flavonoid glycosyltransferase YjiC (YdhE family)